MAAIEGQGTGAAEMDEIPPERLRRVVIGSSLGTIFEWYDFFIYGALATIVSRHFFTTLPDSQAFVFTLLTFAAGFIVRPLGALVFGKIGDSSGRKGAFLVTIVMMGIATFAIGLLPDFDWFETHVGAGWGIVAPILLVTCRVLQGFALGGEYGGAVIYVAEHAPQDKRGLNTGYIQTCAALGLISALGVVLVTRTIVGEEVFRDWGWRVPFLLSIGLLAVSVWIRMRLEESPAFQKMKAEGKQSKEVFKESFLKPRNLGLVIMALFGVMMAQGVVWYTGHFYAQFFLERILKVEGVTVNMLLMGAVTLSAFFYMFFAWLSDRVGRKAIMLFGMVLMLVSYFPGFHLLTQAANPALAAAQERAPVVVLADPADCSFQFDLVGAGRFTSSCDIAKRVLADAGVSYENAPGPAGAPAAILVGETRVPSEAAASSASADLKAAREAVSTRVRAALSAGGYPDKADPAQANFALVFLVLMVFVVAATALYGPLAAALVELFPTRIRYTALSFPYHVGTGWFGGLLPAISFAIVTATGDIYSGLWYPFAATIVAIAVTVLFMPETKSRDIHA